MPAVPVQADCVLTWHVAPSAEQQAPCGKHGFGRHPGVPYGNPPVAEQSFGSSSEQEWSAKQQLALAGAAHADAEHFAAEPLKAPPCARHSEG